MSVAGKASSRFSEVDSLRAIACVLVIWEHTAAAYSGVASSGHWMCDFSYVAQLGPLGVYIFFIISGYVIPRSLREVGKTGENGESSIKKGGVRRRWLGVKRFVICRFWRLYPPFWIALLVSWLGHPTATMRRLVWGATMFPSVGGEPVVAGQFWTLEFELLLYVSVSTLFFCVGRLTWRVLAPVYLGLVGWCLFRADMLTHSLHPMRGVLYLGLMFYGAVCREIIECDFSKLKQFGQEKKLRCIAIGLVTGFLILPALNWIFVEGLEEISLSLVRGWAVINAALIFLFWAVLTPIRISWLTHVGRWTYSTYLFHTVIFYGFLVQIKSGLLTHFSELPMPVYVAVVTVVSFAFGALAYRWIEQPSDRIGKRLSQGLR